MKPSRNSLRLKNYNYSQSGLYFVTICINQRKELLSEIVDDKVILNDAGKMVEDSYFSLQVRFPNISCDSYVIMPNHIHFIFKIKECDDNVGVVPCANPSSRQPQGIAATNKPRDQNSASLSEVVAALKSISTVQYIRGVTDNGWQKFDKRLWQRNYYEHVIRSEESYIKIAEYIENNPINWAIDELNPHFM